MATLTPTETHAIMEIARAHAVEIEKLGLHASMAQDEDLRQLLREAQRKMLRHYEELRSYGEREGDDANARVDAGAGTGFGTATGAYGATNWAAATPAGGAAQAQPREKAPWTPELSPRSLSDRVIVTDLLECCKHLATFCVAHALECSNRNLRRTFKHLADDHVDMNYEAFRHMQERGWYGLRSAGEQEVRGIATQFRSPQRAPAQAFGADANRAYAGSATSSFGRRDWETAEGHGFDAPPASPWRDSTDETND